MAEERWNWAIPTAVFERLGDLGEIMALTVRIGENAHQVRMVVDRSVARSTANCLRAMADWVEDQ